MTGSMGETHVYLVPLANSFDAVREEAARSRQASSPNCSTGREGLIQEPSEREPLVSDIFARVSPRYCQCKPALAESRRLVEPELLLSLLRLTSLSSRLI
jgi:hypothetical protein